LVILNDILDFSRMEAGKIVFDSQPFAPANIVDTTVLMMKSKAQQKGINLNYQLDGKTPKTVLGDSVRLSQILINLISNSLKFTENGSISVSVICIKEDMESVWLDFSVKDTGIGIPIDKQSKIFESFEQATNDTARKFGGAGLGLSIVKQLVKLQNGEISVTSSPENGTDIHIQLPFLKYSEKIDGVIQNGSATPLSNGTGIHILVVEDNPINQMLVIKVLKKQGFETDVAENGLIALNKLKDKDFHIILMDVQMPEMDGYEATVKIRELESYKKEIPIIAMTAHTFKGEYERCIEMGMNDYISKPFDSKDLYQKIFKLLKPNGVS